MKERIQLPRRDHALFQGTQVRNASQDAEQGIGPSSQAGARWLGVATLMKDAGFTRGGFYAHFASEDALICAALTA